MPLPLARGLYEVLLTELVAERLDAMSAGVPELIDLHSAEASDRISLHLSAIVARVIDDLPEKNRVATGIKLARLLLAQLSRKTGSEFVEAERPAKSGKVLRAIRGLRPDGQPERIEQPLIPLLDTTLLTNAPGEPRIGHQIYAEIASADRIDLVIAFIRQSGINPLVASLQKHVSSGRALRVLTTVYTGSTESGALERLESLGADVRVSYDTTSTRLHAKAWLFHRDSGFSTAYVGSSNLTHSAQQDGLEWNVRLSAARNRPVIEKISAVFESYWQQPDFEKYDRERFHVAIGSPRPAAMLALSPIEIRLEPFQERLLEQIALSRQQGFHRNLLASATGTGKTVMAAVDYARLKMWMPGARLLFVAHREEILEQSRATFAHALRDASFGEYWMGGQRPAQFDHVFASIQSLSANGLGSIDPDHFDVIIVDEFHHAAAASYERLLSLLQPKELLGLTATPERSDGLEILHWFGGRIAAELRLWDAIDQHRLTPFAYYGIADSLDFRDIPWTRGRGYDVDVVTDVITATDVWARSVIKQFRDRIGDVGKARALGFCVSVNHARYVARVFNEHGINAVAVSGDSSEADRRSALNELRAGRMNVVFSVDLFNEGVDVPAVDCILMLRPTESPLLFLQQLGRGLRKIEGKTVCTVLDFVGQHRREFRYDRRFQALLGGSRDAVAKQIEARFPYLPSGCHMELDTVAQKRVLQSIRDAVPRTWAAKVAELRSLAAERLNVDLSEFLEASGLELEDIYKSNRSWSDLRVDAGLYYDVPGPYEQILRRACGRLLHVDDSQRLDAWRIWLSDAVVPSVDAMSLADRRLLRMLVVQVLGNVKIPVMSLQDGASLLWKHGNVRRELVELFEFLSTRIPHFSVALPLSHSDIPLRVHARYARLEIQAATTSEQTVRVEAFREGVRYVSDIATDLLLFTLDKTTGAFSPTTRYRDYAISRELIHWESQSQLRADTPTGRRYQEHVRSGSHIFLFARRSSEDRAFHFLGPAKYVSHVREAPMAITWRLEVPLPGDLFQVFAAAVA